MQLTVHISLDDQYNFPETAVIHVEVRDVSLLDAPSKTVSAFSAPLGELEVRQGVASVSMIVPPGEGRRSLNVWAHIAMDGDKKVKKGDFLTVQSYPVDESNTSAEVAVGLRKI